MGNNDLLPDFYKELATDKIVRCDTFGSISWFFMDGFWLFGWEAPMLLFGIPALVLHVLILFYDKRPLAYFCVNAAMCSWVFMNIFWSVGDLHGTALFEPVAKTFFSIGVAILIFGFLWCGYQNMLRALTERFRRLRVIR